jgi:hypothetical protein
MLDNNGANIGVVAAGNNLYQLHNSGRIWRSTGVPCSGESCPGWQMLDNNGATIGIVAAGTIFSSCITVGGSGVPPVLLAAANPARAGRCWTTTAGRAA